MTISVIFEHHKSLEDANSTVFCKGGFGSEFVLGKLCLLENFFYLKSPLELKPI